MFSKSILILLFLFILLDSGKKDGVAGEGQLTEPWQEEIFSARGRTRQEKAVSASQRVAQGFIRFFQIYVSPVDGDRCPSYPTCSQYAVEAIHKHGAVAGLIMTFDRLIHEADEVHRAPQIRVNGSYRYYDPVENNDFWWKK